jgi:Icc protein
VTVLAHLSDPHLDTGPKRLQRLQRVLEQVRALPDVAAVIVTGDIADHGAPEEYVQFRRAMPDDLPTLVVPGNHDVGAVMSQALGVLDGESDGDGAANRTITVGDLTVIGLDSHIDHADEGELGPAAVQFAHDALRSARGPVILALHHPPVPVGHRVMDQFGLQNPHVLETLVRHDDRIVGVLTGHVHTALATTFAGRLLLGAPGIASTMRLGSKTDPIADPAAVPGFALHTVRDTTISTVFHYLTPAAG